MNARISRRRRLDQRGMTLVEVVIATVILATMATSLITVRSFMAKQTVRVQERVVTSMKALQMMEELRALVAANETKGIGVLDDYHSGSLGNIANFSPVLTSVQTVTNPADPLSGNTSQPSGWKFLRHIEVLTVPGQADPNMRQVTVRVYLRSEMGNLAAAVPIAQASAILRTITTPLVPSQGYDVYVIQPYNIPGWWVNVGLLDQVVDEMTSDITKRNPGFEPRIHKITRLAYGRDREYAPFVNDNWTANSTASPYVYFYPGRILVDSDQEYRFFWASLFEKGGAQINRTNSWDDPSAAPATYLVNDVTAGPKNYALADQFNHAVRYPEEVRRYNMALAAAQAETSDPKKWPEISLRMLLEKMNTTPDEFRNVLLINLGGEMLPIPPMRNFSDAAKWPDGQIAQIAFGANTFPLDAPNPPVTMVASGPATYIYEDTMSLLNYRVVTHPEQLAYNSSSTAVTLRVYPYMMRPGSFPADMALPVITLFFPNDNISFGASDIQKINGNPAIGYSKVTAAAGVDYEVSSLGDGTVLRLYNTEMRNGQFVSGTNVSGLATGAMIDALEYVPCPLGGASSPYTQFTGNELSDVIASTSTGSGARNTARWIIRVSGLSALASQNPHVIETRLGGVEHWAPGSAQVTLGGLATFAEGETTDLQNLSRTYVWTGGNAPPVTEQFQVMGDARHCPYADVKASARYNWFFRNPGATGTNAFRGFAKAETYGAGGWKGLDGWGMEFDYPGVSDFYRQGFLKSAAIWSTLNGYSQWNCGLGGEIGAEPQDPTANGIRVNTLPWTSNGANSNNIVVNEIARDGAYSTNNGLSSTNGAWKPGGRRVITRTDNSWSARYWLGELFPDSSYETHWKKGSAGVVGNGGGNLPTGVGNFYRAAFMQNSVLGRNLCTTLGSPGPVQFMNGTTEANAPSAKWYRPENDTDASRTTLGTQLALMFSFPMPVSFPSAATRPFRLDDSDTAYRNNTFMESEEIASRVWVDIPSVGGVKRRFYDPGGLSASTYTNAGIIRVRKVAGSVTNCFYVASNGIAASGKTGPSQIAKIVLITMMRTFFDGGLVDVAGTASHITQLPLADVTKPEQGEAVNPANGPATLQFVTAYRRWGGQIYTEEYSNTYAEPSSIQIEYGLKYSDNIGGPWYWFQDGVQCYEGEKPTGSHIFYTGSAPVTFTTTLNLDSPVSFPDGKVYLRLEGYRAGFNLHYCYDMTNIRVQR